MKFESSNHAIYSLQHEIQCLAEEQTDAIETETFIGLTPRRSPTIRIPSCPYHRTGKTTTPA